jgi:hypothetical protein
MTSLRSVRVSLLLSVAVASGASACTVSSLGPDGDDGEEAGADAGADQDPGSDPGDTPDGGTSESAVVSMNAVVLQSQVEPFRGDQPDLAEQAAVEKVQRALTEEGFEATVDGWFGNGTADAYAAWQRSLGYSGLGANGIPGPSSLAALAEGRFEIDGMIEVGSHTTFTGKTVNQRTKDMLIAADALVAHSIVLSQGSYNPGGVDASAGTHDGGGCVDISVSSLSTTQRLQTVKALRTVGFAAWLRSPDEGPWPYHIHAVAIADTDLAITARNQVADYYVGKNGLASHAGDSTPADYKAPFTVWEAYRDAP